MSSPDLAIDVSVVVATFNRAAMLRETLRSLVELETDGAFAYEVLVVDNASSDNTPQAITEFAAVDRRGSAVRVRGVREPSPGVSHARNRGVGEAAGDWVAFHDDDQVADPRWLAELVALAKRRSALVVGGAVKLKLPAGAKEPSARYLRQMLGEKVGMPAEQPFNRRQIPGAGSLMIDRGVFDHVGLFDTDLEIGGEDADLYRRIRAAGYEAWYTPKAIVHHLIPAKRLDSDYMRWTAARHGQHVALREFLDWGPRKLPLVMAARLGQATINYLPRYLAARLTGDRDGALAARCLMLRSQSYLAKAWRLLLHGEGQQGAADAALSLREGRERLVGGQAPEAETPPRLVATGPQE
ncbi:putative glycosyltransferase EpsH [Pseudobythopirellula maris]|uniref:Putative glycosyltransferase EpsH n=1 Tax=Pseudobythopirellula maris TaxID=2527991 RepID=A0A5C5ZTR3_9BACT|nr:glycosyltransferase family A protein [Pseudobythopirellula maris]TWT90241.1 putative glycosyltransferase EpsH [Pseudobythopirellula maris]